MPPLLFLNSHPIQYFAPLYRYLCQHGVSLEVVYYSGGAKEHFDQEFNRSVQWDIDLLEGYPSLFLENSGKGAENKTFRSLYNPGIISYLRNKPKSLVVVHSWQYSTDWLAMLAAKWYGHKLVFWTEANFAFERLQSPFRRLLKRLRLKPVFRLADHFFYIGQHNRAFYEAFGIAPQKLVHTPYAVDNERFRRVAITINRQEARLKTGLPAGKFLILFSGKYILKKRPLDLLAAVAALDNPQVHLVMVGEGALRTEMEHFIRERQLENRVTLTGFINQSRITLYYAASDAFVMCSGIGETWGLSVNEAMNFNLPVVVSDLTGCSADLVREGVNGYIFPTGDVQKLTACLERLIQMSADRLSAMGSASARRVEQFSYRQFLEGITPILNG